MEGRPAPSGGHTEFAEQVFGTVGRLFSGLYGALSHTDRLANHPCGECDTRGHVLVKRPIEDVVGFPRFHPTART